MDLVVNLLVDIVVTKLLQRLEKLTSGKSISVKACWQWIVVGQIKHLDYV